MASLRPWHRFNHTLQSQDSYISIKKLISCDLPRAVNLREFCASVNPRFEAGIPDFMDGILDFMENFNTF